MKTSHRNRLALVTASVSGVILAALFALAIYIFRTEEVRRAHDILRPAILQTSAAEDQDRLWSDLSDVIKSNPQLSFAAFNLKGDLLGTIGATEMESTFKWAYSMKGKPTNASHIEWGIVQIGKNDVVIGSISTKEGLLVGVLPWTERERTMNLATIALVVLWFPLVGLVGAITWFASERTFAPIEQLTKQAELFSESDLGRRLQIEGKDEVALFARRLNHFLDRIEDSVSRQQRFVEDAAHELRTPLTILRGRIETTLLSVRTPEEYKEALVLALRETERMSRLVEAMLQSALPVLDTNTALDVEEVLEQGHARWLDRYIESGVQLVLETQPIKVKALEEEIGCVVDNLLTNALRASPKGSTVTVGLQGDGMFALVTVTDEGEGVPMDKREAIFDRFTRLEKSRNRSLGGFGVGLAVCRRLVEARGGSIRVTDGPTGGARFEVRWPLAA